jgi:hypothetical protein
MWNALTSSSQYLTLSDPTLDQVAISDVNC